MSIRLTLLFLAFTIIPGNASGAIVSEAEAEALAVYRPVPAYPYEARARRITGTGAVRVEVDKRTGHVTSVRILQSTGQEILDRAALDVFRQWRFKQRTVTTAEIPVRFTTKGVVF